MNDAKHLTPGSLYRFGISEKLYGVCRIDKVFPADSEIAREHYLNDAQEDCYQITVTPWLDESPTDFSDPLLQATFHLTHHSWKNEAQIILVNGPAPKEFEWIGSVTPNAQMALTEYRIQGCWNASGFGDQLMRQHEWDTGDPKEILAREAAERQVAFEKQRQEKEARKQRLAALGPEGFTAQNPFEHWASRAIPAALTSEAQTLFRQTMNSIAAAKPRSRKKAVLAALKEMIQGFNKLQKQYGGLETVERDDLTRLMGDILHISKVVADPAILFEQWEDM